MSDFQNFRTAVLEDDDLQEQVISIVNTATANGSGLGDGIATLAKTHGYTITSEEVYEHADFLGQVCSSICKDQRRIYSGEYFRQPQRQHRS